MDFSHEWKSLLPIGGVLGAPLLLTGSTVTSVLGPLCFNPIPDSLIRLSNSEINTTRADFADSNLIQLFHCNSSFVFVFFANGSSISYLIFQQKPKQFVSCGRHPVEALDTSFDDIFTASPPLNQQVRGILVNPVSDCDNDDDNTIIGNLLAYCTNSVHWFGIKQPSSTSLVYIGSKSFETSTVVTACWSPHLLEECAVLLDNGSLFLLNSDPTSGLNAIQLKVSWDHQPPDSKWLGCEFAWNPRTLIIARSDATFLIDRWSCDHKPKITRLANVDMSGPYGTTPFVAFSKAVSSHFHFILVSSTLLLVCDIRKPFSPILQWEHHLDRPSYVQTFSLSNLRSNSDTHKWATESGFVIVVGSSEFSLFCYGPSLPAPYSSITSKIDEISNSLYAWELPSNLNLQNADCACNTCLVKESFSEDVISHEKRNMVIGFGILRGDDNDDHLSSEFGGFTLIRLMTSGKLELERYSASWDLTTTLKHHHTLPTPLVYNLLYPAHPEDNFTKRYKYLQLKYLPGHLNDNLLGTLENLGIEMKPFGKDCHEALCNKLAMCGVNKSPSVGMVLANVCMPTSIHEVASMTNWAALPIQLMEHAFCNYTQLLDKKKEDAAFESLPVPDDLPQLPPFWSRKPLALTNVEWLIKNAFAGPILPLPLLITVDKLQKEEVGKSTVDAQLDRYCNQVTEMIKEVAAMSLGSDAAICADSGNAKSLLVYRPVSFESSSNNDNCRSSAYPGDHSYSTLITKPQTKKEEDIFADICPIDLKSDAQLPDFSSQEFRICRGLKRHMAKWLKQSN